MNITIHIYPIYYILLVLIAGGCFCYWNITHGCIESDGGVTIASIFFLAIFGGVLIGAILAKILIFDALYTGYIILGGFTIIWMYKLFKRKAQSSIIYIFGAASVFVGTILTKFLW